jgi:hypothetical protein
MSLCRSLLLQCWMAVNFLVRAGHKKALCTLPLHLITGSGFAAVWGTFLYHAIERCVPHQHVQSRIRVTNCDNAVTSLAT